MRRIRVWDWPTRIVHWTLFPMVGLAMATGLAGGNWMDWHGRVGLLILGLLAFRLAWGVLGSTYARFAQFAPGPGRISAYLRGRWHGPGHNPLGALSVLALLTVLLLQAVSGLFSSDDIAFGGPLAPRIGGDSVAWLSGLHRQNVWLLGALIAVHLAAVLFYLWVRGNDLIRPMLTGEKAVDDPAAEPARGGGPLAVLVALAVALGAMWLASGGLSVAPPVPPPAVAPAW